jgi:MSHA pilin protein MshA
MRSNICIDSVDPRDKGNSLIELVVVITIVGILASFAVPRFAPVASDVRASEVVALSVNLRNAAAAAHEQYVRSGSTLSSARLKGRVIQLQNGYPDAGPQGIRLAMSDLSDFTTTSTPTSVTYSKIGAPAAARCAVTYRASAAASDTATVTGLDTSGC